MATPVPELYWDTGEDQEGWALEEKTNMKGGKNAMLPFAKYLQYT